MMKYFQGIYDLRLVYSSPTAHLSCGTIYGIWWDMGIQDNLANYYKNNLQINSTKYFSGEQWLPASCYQIPFYKNWIYEILGRMCHLLQDMSVPAHVHCNSHAGTNGMYSDYYENNAKYFHQWTANEIYNNGEGIIDPYQQNWGHPIAYLMYYLNQITDHYASGRTNGDDLYDTNCPGLNSVIPNLLSPITTAGINQTNCSQMHDVLQPLAIRTTAGLLYWFAKEADILPVPITEVSLDGTSTLYSEMTGNWFTEKSHGISPFTYNWEIMYINDGGNLESYQDVTKIKDEKEKKGKDDIIIRAAPNNEWVPCGLNQSYFQKPHNPYDLRDFYLKCTVTDGSNTTVTSNIKFVEVVSYPPPQASVVNAGNSETAQIAEEISLNKQNQDAVTSASELPEGFALEQNYPNPFNPATNINYSIPEGCFVTLKVYDMLGREAAALVNENKPAGRFTVTFNAAELPSGTYIYKLTAGAHTIVKKMSFVK